MQCEILNSFPCFVGLSLQLHVPFLYPHESVLARQEILVGIYVTQSRSAVTTRFQSSGMCYHTEWYIDGNIEILAACISSQSKKSTKITCHSSWTGLKVERASSWK